MTYVATLSQMAAGVCSVVLCVLLLVFRRKALRYITESATRQHELDDHTRDSIPGMLVSSQAESARRAGEMADADAQIARIKAGESWIHEQ